MKIIDLYVKYPKIRKPMAQNLSKLVPEHLLVAASTLASKAIIALAQLLSIRLVSEELGVDNYSIFALLSALAAWAVLADFGIGSSIQNFVSELRAKGKEAHQVIYNALIATLISMILFVIFTLVSGSSLANFYLLGAHFLSDDQKIILFDLSFIFFILNITGIVTQRIWFAQQRGWIANIVSAASALSGIIGLLLVDIRYFKPPLLGAIVVFYGPGVLISFIAYFIIFPKDKKLNLKIDFEIMRALLDRGIKFWIYACITILVAQSDYLVLSQQLGAKDIFTYSLIQKIFIIPLVIYVAILQALWPVCVELRVLQKWDMIETLVKKYILWGLLGIFLFTLLFYLFNDKIIRLFASDIEFPISLIITFGAYYMIRVWTDTYSMLLQSMNDVKPFWIFVPIQGFITIMSQYWLSQSFGIIGITGGMILGYVMTAAIICPYLFYKKSRLQH